MDCVGTRSTLTRDSALSAKDRLQPRSDNAGMLHLVLPSGDPRELGWGPANLVNKGGCTAVLPVSHSPSSDNLAYQNALSSTKTELKYH